MGRNSKKLAVEVIIKKYGWIGRGRGAVRTWLVHAFLHPDGSEYPRWDAVRLADHHAFQFILRLPHSPLVLRCCCSLDNLVLFARCRLLYHQKKLIHKTLPTVWYLNNFPVIDEDILKFIYLTQNCITPHKHTCFGNDLSLVCNIQTDYRKITCN